MAGAFSCNDSSGRRFVSPPLPDPHPRITYQPGKNRKFLSASLILSGIVKKSCGNSPSLKETSLHAAILEAIRSLIHGQQEKMAAALQDTLIRCIAGEKEGTNPNILESEIKELETEFDRLLILAVDENDILDYKLKQLSETIRKLKQQQKKQLEQTSERSKVMERKVNEIMELITSEGLDLTEYSDTLVYRIIEKVTVLSKEKIRIHFIGGFEITQSLR